MVIQVAIEHESGYQLIVSRPSPPSLHQQPRNVWCRKKERKRCILVSNRKLNRTTMKVYWFPLLVLIGYSYWRVFIFKGSTFYFVTYLTAYNSISVAWEPNFLGAAELMPTDVRAKSTALLNIISRLASVLASQMVGYSSAFSLYSSYWTWSIKMAPIDEDHGNGSVV